MKRSKDQIEKFVKYVCFILKDSPSSTDIELNVNKNGYTNIGDLVNYINLNSSKWNTSIEEILRLSKEYDFLLRTKDNNIIKCISNTFVKVSKGSGYYLPEKIYHGTPVNNIEIILKEGIRNIKRNFVHLSSNKGDAIKYGGRFKDKKPVIVTVDIRKMIFIDGIEFFYDRKNNLWLTKYVDPKYIVDYQLIK